MSDDTGRTVSKSQTTAEAGLSEMQTRLPGAKCVSFWLGGCPDSCITGTKIISVKTRDLKSRSAMALRLAAQSLWHCKDSLGECFAAGKPASPPKPSPP